MSSKAKAKTESRSIDVLFDVLLRHPYLFVALMCLLLLPFGFAQLQQITTEGVVIEAVIWIVAVSALIALGKPSEKPAVNVYLILSSAAAIVLFSVFVEMKSSNAQLMFLPALFILAQFVIVLARDKALNTERLVLLLILLAVVLRYCYVLHYNCMQIQHDVGNFNATSGHAPYIMYWYNNGLTLPDFNVTTRWQFYHPPLHHILMAGGLRILTTFGLPLEQAQEAIQILPMLYSSLSMVVCFRLFRLLELKGAGLAVAMTVICFYPTFIIWGGEYNNDMLCTLFMLLAMLWTVKWYQDQRLRNILPIALCVGCGMMTKLSAWMVAPAIAFVFLCALIKNIKKPLPYIGQYAAFGAVCAPLGLWWGVRNLLTFNVPITYVPNTNMAIMSVENVPAAQRLFDFSLFQLQYPYEAFTMYQAPYNEYNPFMGLLKTSLFDEHHLSPQLDGLATVMVFAAFVLVLLSVISLVYLMFQKKACIDFTMRFFLLIIFLTIIISYYLFCFQFPHVCTENIRYCMPVIPILALALGFGVNSVAGKIKQKKQS